MLLHNALTGKKERFEPADPARPTMYVCGPTVYSYPHIGNARSAVVFDVLHRVLKHRFGDVLYARNVTDIEDKIIQAAAEQGVPTTTIVERYTPAYHADMAALGVLPPTIEPFRPVDIPVLSDLPIPGVFPERPGRFQLRCCLGMFPCRTKFVRFGTRFVRRFVLSVLQLKAVVSGLM